MNNLKKVLIIAEAGVNHNGSLDLAKKLVEKACDAGADVVKFQTYNTRKFVSKYAEMADYQKKNTGKFETQQEMLSKLMLQAEDFKELADYCKNLKIGFLSTPFDIESIRYLNSIQHQWKVPSGEITNYPYLVEIAKTGKDVILSTGMSTLEEIDAALYVLKRNGTKKVTILHCTTDYPTPMEDVNLNAMLTLKNQFACPVGYSDHTQGIEIPIAAVGMGAEVIEKHFTLDRNMAGPDHKASLEPNELASMVKAIRKIECAMGDGVKKPTDSEKLNMIAARKSIVAAKAISKGEFFTEENLTTKRPGNGISPMKWTEIIGSRSNKDYVEDELIIL